MIVIKYLSYITDNFCHIKLERVQIRFAIEYNIITKKLELER